MTLEEHNAEMEHAAWEADARAEDEALRRFVVIRDLKNAGDRKRTAEEKAVVARYAMANLKTFAVLTTSTNGATSMVLRHDHNPADAVRQAAALLSPILAKIEVWEVK